MTSPAASPSTPLSDEERRLLGELYESSHDAVLRLCARILRDPEDAADACHEVFFTASRECVGGRLPENPRGWLLTVARNHCLDVLRRQKRLGKILTTMGSSLEDGVNPESTVIGRQNVDSVLRGLSPRERQALWQSAVERRTLADIANGLRLNYMAAAQVLSRARRHAAVAMARVAAILFGLRVFRNIARSGGVPRSAILTHSVQLIAIAVVPLALATTVASSGAVHRQTVAGAPPSLVAPAKGVTVARADQRGNVPATGVAPTRATGLPVTPVGASAAIPSTASSTVSQVTNGQLTNVLPSAARGLPPVPAVSNQPSVPSLPPVAVTVSPTIPPLPKVP